MAFAAPTPIIASIVYMSTKHISGRRWGGPDKTACRTGAVMPFPNSSHKRRGPR